MKKTLQKTTLILALISQTFANAPLSYESENSLEIINIEPPQNLLETAPFNAMSYNFAPLAGGLSYLAPGLGQIYNGNISNASTYILCNFSYVLYNIVDDIGHAAHGGTSSSTKSISISFQNLRSYSAYAAYRDARNLNGSRHGSHLYKHQMPKEGLLDLLLAPVNFEVIRKPEVWGALFPIFAGAMILASTYDLKTPTNAVSLSSKHHHTNPLIAFPVGIGEEALFRGFIQSSFMEILPPAPAIALSSIIFGAAHIPNAQDFPKSQRVQYYYKSIPWISACGAYMGYLTYKNQSLKESTALHVWYDFTLFLASSVATSVTMNSSTEEIAPKEYVFSTFLNF